MLQASRVPTTYRLRYQTTDLELQPGEFVIGRSSTCNLAVDDALVSRRHAAFRVGEAGVTVEDLGSRNGVTVNGAKIAGPTALRHLDRVVIGSQEMVLLEVGNRFGSSPPTGEFLVCEMCGAAVPIAESSCRSCGTPVGRSARQLAATTLELKLPPGGIDLATGPDDITRTAVGFTMVAAIADKALGLGRFEEAERIVAKHLEALIMRGEKGAPLPVELLMDATRFALRLGEGLRKPRWIDYAFRLHEVARTMMAGPTVDRLHELVRKIDYKETRPLRSYLAAMTPMRDRLSPAEKFALQRLEGLERVISA